MRGRFYVYRGSGLHISTPDGDVSMPFNVFDELVAMRWAQMPVGARLASEKRAIKKYQGNGGCDALCKKYGKKTMTEMVEEEVKRKLHKKKDTKKKGVNRK